MAESDSFKEYSRVQKGWKTLRTMLLLLCLSVSCNVLYAAEITPDLSGDYLEGQFDWAMFVEAQAVKHYLNYEGSTLKPLTRVRIYFRVYKPSQSTGPAQSKSKIFEEYWYYKGALIGLRRHEQLDIERDKIGAVVVGKRLVGSEEALAVSKTLVRLTLDLQFQHILASLVMVPEEQYDAIAGGFSNYHLVRNSEPQQGEQFSIHLRSYDAGRDDYFYLH